VHIVVYLMDFFQWRILVTC